MSNSLDDGAQFAGSDTSLPPGPFSASSRGTFGRLQAPRHGVANTNAALKSDADRNRGGGEKNEKSRQKTSSRRKSKIKKSNRRGRRQKTSESNPLRVAGVRAGGTTTEAQVTEEPKLRPCNVCKSSKKRSRTNERFSGPGLQPPPSDHSRLLVEGRSAESGLLDNSYEVIENM